MPETPLTDEHHSSLIPNGTLVTTYKDLDCLLSSGSDGLPVLLDRGATPWILFCTEDGDTYAATVPFPDLAIPSHVDLGDLVIRGPLRVVFNGNAHSYGWVDGPRTKEVQG